MPETLDGPQRWNPTATVNLYTEGGRLVSYRHIVGDFSRAVTMHPIVTNTLHLGIGPSLLP